MNRTSKDVKTSTPWGQVTYTYLVDAESAGVAADEVNLNEEPESTDFEVEEEQG
jgi:hypothetical protein